jgi:hypothetical protein
MGANATVAWAEHFEPWLVEHELLRRISSPLNIEGNAHHCFSARLNEVRRQAKRRARELPVVVENGSR